MLLLAISEILFLFGYKTSLPAKIYPDMCWSPGTEVIKLFSCSTQLRMKFVLLINVKMPTAVGILTFMSRKSSILGLPESNKSRIS